MVTSSNNEYPIVSSILLLCIVRILIQDLFNPIAGGGGGGPPQLPVEAVIAEDDGFESASYDATDGFGVRQGGFESQDKIEAPKVSLRSFFPETWLFTLDPVNEDSNLSR